MGEVFAGRYELVDPIATGGMGTVWLAVDRSDGQLKAAKILRQSDAGSLLRFVREQSMRIDHDHVVTPDSWAGMDDRVLFTMPLVRGGSVADLVRSHGALPVRWVALLLDQTLQALEAVHAAGIAHRDVKPGNLLLEATGLGRPHLRITDFGIAAPVDGPRMTQASVAIGTPGYMAPEQLHGGDPDPRSDLYAAGIVAVEMLTGTRPATGQPVDVDTLRTADPSRNALLDVVATALHPDPAQRVQSAAEMRSALAALGLDNMPPAPGESISLDDRFATTQVPRTTTSRTRSLTGVTRGERNTPTPTSVMHHPAPASAGRLPAALLLLVGMLCLAGAGVLWFV